MTDKPFDESKYPNLSLEEIDLMNNRYEEQKKDYELADEGQGFDTDNDKQIRALITEIESDLNGATQEEIALLVYLHKQGEKDLWVYDVRDKGPHFWEGTLVERGNRQYGVVMDEHVEDIFKNYMQEYIDNVVTPEIPEAYRNYFDEERFIDDVKDNDGMGGMASYDGDDNEVYIGDQLWHIFRVN